jgi:AcrR family transcriptional regulator
MYDDRLAKAGAMTRGEPGMSTLEMTTQEKILAAAREEFGARGLDGARVDRIARAAGVNKAMIYYHFRSKEQLYETVVQQFIDSLAKFLGRVLTEEADLESLLLAVSAFYGRVFETSREMRPIMLREMAAGGDRARNLFIKMFTEVDAPRKIRALFESEVRKGRLRKVDTPQTFVSFVGMNLFYLLFAPVINSIWEIQDEQSFRRSRPEAVVDLFLNGVRSR